MILQICLKKKKLNGDLLHNFADLCEVTHFCRTLLELVEGHFSFSIDVKGADVLKQLFNMKINNSITLDNG